MKVVKSLRRPFDLAQGKRIGGAVERGRETALFLGQTRGTAGLDCLGYSREHLRPVTERRGINQVPIPRSASKAGTVDQ